MVEVVGEVPVGLVDLAAVAAMALERFHVVAWPDLETVDLVASVASAASVAMVKAGSVVHLTLWFVKGALCVQLVQFSIQEPSQLAVLAMEKRVVLDSEASLVAAAPLRPRSDSPCVL